MIRSAVRYSLPILLLCLPLLAADPIYGVWKVREDAQNPALKSELMKVEEVAGGTKFTFDIVTTQQKLSYYYITELDGKPVSAMAKKKPFSQVKVKKISPFEYETTMLDLTTEQNYKSTISKDGKTLINDGTGQARGQTLTIHKVYEKVQ
jgi:hypothetical protein